MRSLVFVLRGHYACTVVLAAKGYPEAPKKGAFIKGLDKVDAKDFYHAGTRLGEDSVFSRR